MTDSTPSGLLLFLISFILLLSFVLLLWAINVVKRRVGSPQRSMRQQPTLRREAMLAPSLLPPQGDDLRGPRPIAIRDWLERVNHQPDRAPHIAAKGPSGSGKSTLILAMLADRPGKVLVCTPKNERDDAWGGAPAVRLTRDLTFSEIESALQAVYQEVKRRNVEEFEDWLTLVVDDYPWIAQECPSASKVVTMVANMGRSVRVRLILLAQTATVKSWGFEGNGEARSNFVFIDLEEDHSATMYRWGKTPEAIDTSHVADLARRQIPSARWWKLPQSSDADAKSNQSSPSATWTEQHVKVAAWLIAEPNISTREIARRLYPGTDGGGDYSTRTKAVRLFVEQLLETDVLGVRTLNNTASEAQPNT